MRSSVTALTCCLICLSNAFAQSEEVTSTNLGVEFVFVRGGTFLMGDLWDVTYSEDEKPIHTVTLSDFWMSRYEITNYQFCVFLNERGNVVEGGKPWLDVEDPDCLIRRQGRRFSPKRGFWYHPVIETTWYGAMAFAEWLGCRLPTEAEWEYAARVEGRDIMFPHGRMLTHDDANFAGKGGKDVYDWTSPIGKFPSNLLGLFDMAGNVWERCQDWYDEDYYRIDSITNPAGPDSGQYRTMRGGAWSYSQINCRTTIRGINRPDEANDTIGFRIVRDVREADSEPNDL